MDLSVVNHEDYFAKIGDDHKFPINKFGELAKYLIDKKYNTPNNSKNSNTNMNTCNINITNLKSKSTDNIFRIVKTTKPDVYDLYKKKNDEFTRQGILLVQSLKESHLLGEYFRNKTSVDEIMIECDYDNYFNKWKFKKFL